MRLWEVATGKCLFTWEFTTAAKRVAFSEDCTQVLVVTEQRMGYRGALRVFRINRDPATWTQQDPEPTRTITFSGPKAVVAAFAPCDQYIITGHENGKVATYYHDEKEPESGIDAELEENSTDAHSGEMISDLQMSADRTYFVTSSRDKTSKLIDSKTLQVIKTYATETPLNSASIHPTKPFVIVGGGQDAMNVTTTSARQGRFETRFWHKVFEEECARLPGHFGPINTIAIHPAGTAYASGGEDGYVRVTGSTLDSSMPSSTDLTLKSPLKTNRCAHRNRKQKKEMVALAATYPKTGLNILLHTNVMPRHRIAPSTPHGAPSRRCIFFPTLATPL